MENKAQRSTDDVMEASNFRSKTIRTLNKPGVRWLLALAGSVIVSRRNGEACLVTPAGDSLFAHRYSDGTVVYPSFRGLSPSRMKRETLDTFCWDYMPSPGDVILDVGAGIGEEVITFSQLVGAHGRVISVEAQPSTYRRLQAIVKLNKLANVFTIQSAITAEAGSVSMEEVGVDTHVGASLTAAGGVMVPAETLDGLTARLGLGRISLLKMNIEGAERQALAAGSDTLRRTEHVAISCHDFLVHHGANPGEVETFEDVHRILEQHGFSIATRPEDERPWIRYYLYGRQALRPGHR